MRHQSRDQMTMRLDELVGGMSPQRLARLLALAEYLSPEAAEEEFRRRTAPDSALPIKLSAGTCRCGLPEDEPPVDAGRTGECAVSSLDPEGSELPDWHSPA
ncbi:MAG: hypothetical protein JRD89_02425 [Deltaproteobacteria bacterium]|nr:hypothetical protein [Deltaproteobacteria bacterium]